MSDSPENSLADSLSEKVIRSELEKWLDENWSPDRSLLEWRNILVDGGWAATGWPVENYGRGYNREQVALVHNIFREKGALWLIIFIISSSLVFYL